MTYPGGDLGARGKASLGVFEGHVGQVSVGDEALDVVRDGDRHAALSHLLHLHLPTRDTRYGLQGSC